MKLNLKFLLIAGLVFTGADLIPLLLIAHSNKTVFPSTIFMANGMLLISLIASIVCMLSASSRKADWLVRGGALFFMLAIGVITWWQMGGHWQLSREIDGAVASVKEADLERAKLSKLADEDAKRKKSLAESRAIEAEALSKLEKAQAANRDAATRQFRATGLRPRIAESSITAIAGNSPAIISGSSDVASELASPVSVKAKITPEEIRANWNDTLTTRAYIEAGAGIFSLILIIVLWHVGEYDLNRNGIPDRVDRLDAVTRAEVYPQYGGRPVMPMSPAPAALPATRAEKETARGN